MNPIQGRCSPESDAGVLDEPTGIYVFTRLKKSGDPSHGNVVSYSWHGRCDFAARAPDRRVLQVGTGDWP